MVLADNAPGVCTLRVVGAVMLLVDRNACAVVGLVCDTVIGGLGSGECRLTERGSRLIYRVGGGGGDGHGRVIHGGGDG